MIKVLVAGMIEKEGKILFVEEDDGDLNLPTGHLEEGEDIFQGALREIKEETGLDTEIVDIVNIYEYFKKGHNKFRFTFSAKVVGGEEKADGKEILALKWFSKSEIDSMDDSEFRNKDMKIMIDDYFSKKRYNKDIIKILG